MLWSRPENKLFAGKLLIIGGNSQGFAAAGEAYTAAAAARAGSIRVLLPDSLQKLLGRTFEAGEFVPSTPSGSFGQQALTELLATAGWSDGVLLAGDVGRNSETAVLLEKFCSKYPGQLTLVGDAADHFVATPDAVLSRPDTLLVLSLPELQKLAIQAHFTEAFTSTLDTLRFVDLLHHFTTFHSFSVIVEHLDTIFVATSGQVSTTKLPSDSQKSTVAIAAAASTWWMQNPGKTFEAVSTAVLPGAQL